MWVQWASYVFSGIPEHKSHNYRSLKMFIQGPAVCENSALFLTVPYRVLHWRPSSHSAPGINATLVRKFPSSLSRSVLAITKGSIPAMLSPPGSLPDSPPPWNSGHTESVPWMMLECSRIEVPIVLAVAATPNSNRVIAGRYNCV